MQDNLELLHDRYTRALFSSAEEDGTVDEVMEEIEALNEEWLNDVEFHRFLVHPLIAAAEKTAVLEKLLESKNRSRTIINFLRVLINNGRGDILHGVWLRYKDLYELYKNRIRLHVETPRPFTKEEKALLTDILTLKFSGEVSLEVKVNPDLISGIFVKYGDKIYDYSVKGQLDILIKGLKKEPV